MYTAAAYKVSKGILCFPLRADVRVARCPIWPRFVTWEGDQIRLQAALQNPSATPTVNVRYFNETTGSAPRLLRGRETN